MHPASAQLMMSGTVGRVPSARQVSRCQRVNWVGLYNHPTRSIINIPYELEPWEVPSDCSANLNGYHCGPAQKRSYLGSRITQEFHALNHCFETACLSQPSCTEPNQCKTNPRTSYLELNSAHGPESFPLRPAGSSNPGQNTLECKPRPSESITFPSRSVHTQLPACHSCGHGLASASSGSPYRSMPHSCTMIRNTAVLISL